MPAIEQVLWSWLGSQCVVAGLGAAPSGRVGSGGLQGFPHFAGQSLVSAFADHGIKGLLNGFTLGNFGKDESGDGLSFSHGFRVGVEALASCPRILHHAPPWSTQLSNGSTQLRCRLAARPVDRRRQR